MSDDLLADQQDFYRGRAPEYDEWWQRRGSYDHGPDDTAQWGREVAQVERALESFGATGRVLELAGGTGWWTARLARTAAGLTVVDSSAEVLELNRARVGRDDVEYVTADLFAWEPPAPSTYDAVFFSFWLSHVPSNRFEAFWRLVRGCLSRTGRVFLIDNRGDSRTTDRDPFVLEHAGEVQRRRLSDGSEHRVVKIYYEPGALAELMAGLGWEADITGTTRFVYGSARPGRR